MTEGSTGLEQLIAKEGLPHRRLVRSAWLRQLVPVIFCGALGLSMGACGSDSPDDGITADRPVVDGLAGTIVSSQYTSALVPLGSTEAVVVDGASLVEGSRRLRASWVSEGSLRQSVDTEGPSLVYPTAWSVGLDLYVFGRECPKIDLDLVSDIDLLPIEDVCGTAAPHVIRRLDMKDGTWSVAIPTVPEGSGGEAFVLGTSDTSALVRTSDSNVFTIDVSSGEAVELPEVQLAGSTLTQACPVGDNTFLLVSTTALPPGPGEQQASPLTIWRIQGTEATPLSAPPGPAATPFGPVECLPDRGVLGPASNTSVDVLTLGGDGALLWERVDLPASSNGIRIQVAGSVLLAWVPDGDDLIPWRRDGDEWSIAGRRINVLDPPDSPVLVDGQLLALVQQSSEDQPSTTTRVVLL